MFCGYDLVKEDKMDVSKKRGRKRNEGRRNQTRKEWGKEDRRGERGKEQKDEDGEYRCE